MFCDIFYFPSFRTKNILFIIIKRIWWRLLKPFNWKFPQKENSSIGLGQRFFSFILYLLRLYTSILISRTLGFLKKIALNGWLGRTCPQWGLEMPSNYLLLERPFLVLWKFLSIAVWWIILPPLILQISLNKIKAEKRLLENFAVLVIRLWSNTKL